MKVVVEDLVEWLVRKHGVVDSCEAAVEVDSYCYYYCCCYNIEEDEDNLDLLVRHWDCSDK